MNKSKRPRGRPKVPTAEMVELLATIRDMAGKNYTARRAAEELGITLDYLRTLMYRNGIAMDRTAHVAEKVSAYAERAEQIKAMIAEGKSPGDIAALLGMKPPTLRATCLKWGIDLPRRRAGRPRKPQTPTVRVTVSLTSDQMDSLADEYRRRRGGATRARSTAATRRSAATLISSRPG